MKASLVWCRRASWALGLLLLGALDASPRGAIPACTLVWGPVHDCVLHGELAKEGLVVDKFERQFSVGHTDVASGGPKEAMLMIRDGSGAMLSRTLWAATPHSNFAAGLWAPKNGSEVVTAGSCRTNNTANPANLVLTRWLPGGGTPWTTPVQASMVVYTPSALGLNGIEAWGCRVVKASATDLFIAGCTDLEIFVARVDRVSLALVGSWGIGGVQAVAAATPFGCPVHAMPGAFIDFLIHPQSFVEVQGGRVYLGGTLMNDLSGFPTDYDFVVACFHRSSGAMVVPFGVRYSEQTGDEFMRAMAVSPDGVYATGVLNPSSNPELQLAAWRKNGTLRSPGLIHLAGASWGNDVEVQCHSKACEVFVGGHGYAGIFTGAVWHFRHGRTGSSPLVLLPQWASFSSGGQNPKAYGPGLHPTDDVFDVEIGRGLWAGTVFATGQAVLGIGQYGQPLLCVPANGTPSFSNNPTPLAPLADRGVAVVYDPGSQEVFTHGTAEDTIGGFWSCPNHWVTRHTRYTP